LNAPRTSPATPRSALFLFWSAVSAWAAFLGLVLAHGGHAIAHDWGRLLPWACAFAIANLIPVVDWKWGYLAIDLPIAVAAALILAPHEAAIVAFAGAWDVREIKGQLSLDRALFNRVQVSAADALGCWVVHRVTPAPQSSTSILLLAFVALASIMAMNYVSVTLAVRLDRGIPILATIRSLTVGIARDYLLSQAAWAILGTMVAVLYTHAGWIALGACLVPMLLSRQMLLRSKMYIERDAAYRARDAAVTELMRQIAMERADERHLISADLHDEVMQPLFNATLVSQVMKHDLETGRLFELEQDLQAAASATDAAAEKLRGIIGNLRRSPLGISGLPAALERLVADAKGQIVAQIETDIHRVDVDADIELVIYQIAKEALTNAVTHSGSHLLRVALTTEDSTVILAIEDDGVGFDSRRTAPSHFGLAIMRERASSIGASLYIDSSPGSGTRVLLHVPEKVSIPEA
jgi:signal transduction histidine kinase